MKILDEEPPNDCSDKPRDIDQPLEEEKKEILGDDQELLNDAQ